MPAKPRDAKFDADADKLIQSLRAFGGPKLAKRALPKFAAESKAAKKPARTRARTTNPEPVKTRVH
jgi:hypothetical protein